MLINMDQDARIERGEIDAAVHEQVTPAPWGLERNSTEYPDLFTWTILVPNPDAGKSGVPYSGKHLAITNLDCEADARFIVEAVNSHAELKARVRELETVLSNLRDQVDDWAESEDSDGHSEIVNWDEMYAARVALNKGE